jgi:integrase
VLLPSKSLANIVDVPINKYRGRACSCFRPIVIIDPKASGTGRPCCWGVHPKLVQELLGHSSIAITLVRYSHWIPSMGEQTAAAMEAALS